MTFDLEVRRFLDLEALEHGIKLFSFRVWSRVQFKRLQGWTPVMPGLVDTGAPFSVLPKALWSDLSVEKGFDTALRGLVPLRSAVLKARLVRVACIVSDLKTCSSPFTLWAMLAEGDVPLVLGCAGFLDRATLILDGARQRAHLELTS